MRRNRHPFTMVELIVSMAVFALLSMMVVRLFSASQKLWVSSNQKSEISAEGRMALDCISNLLMSATQNPKYNDTRVGSDYFVLDQDGPKINGGDSTSRLYFATKSDALSLMGNSDKPACFAGIQVVKIDESSDPDQGRYALVVSAENSANGDVFAQRFPDNTQTGDGGKELQNSLDDDTDRPFSEILSITSTRKVSRIAANVVDFQIRADSSASKVSGGDGDKTVSVDGTKPAAVEIILTLMDRRHYDEYLNETDSESRNTLATQYGRTFRRIVWLDGNHRSRDISEDWE